MAYKNTLIYDYNSTSEITTMGLKGNFFLVAADITTLPTTGSIEMYSSGADRMILNDGHLYIKGTGDIKFSDGSLQTTAGVGSASNLSGNGDCIINYNADNSTPTAKLSIKNYNTEKASINADGDFTTSGKLIGATVNTGQGDNELYDMDQDVKTTDSPTFNSPIATQLNTDTIKIKTASGDLLIKNQGGDTIATLKNDKNVEFAGTITGTHIGTMQRIYSNTLTANTTSITISGLNGDIDLEYILKITAPSFGEEGLINVYINGDTANNYKSMFIARSNTSTITGGLYDSLSNFNNAISGVEMNSGIYNLELQFSAKTGVYRYGFGRASFGLGANGTGDANRGFYIFDSVWGNTADNITNIVITANVASKLLVGTRIELYARR